MGSEMCIRDRFYNQLSASANRGARWRVIGSQIVFSRVNESMALGNVNPLNYDAWDGYQANRNRTLNHLYQNNIGNNIMLAGDSHASWVSDLVWLDHASKANPDLRIPLRANICHRRLLFRDRSWIYRSRVRRLCRFVSLPMGSEHHYRSSQQLL